MARQEEFRNYVCRLLPCTLMIVVLLNLHESAIGGPDTGYFSPIGTSYFLDNRKQTMWTKTKSKKIASAEEARQYLARINQGEYSDWRLPTKQELYDLFMVFDLKKNGEVRVRVEGKYWLKNGKGETVVGTWEIGDGCGPERAYYSGSEGYVRAVRP